MGLPCDPNPTLAADPSEGEPASVRFLPRGTALFGLQTFYILFLWLAIFCAAPLPAGASAIQGLGPDDALLVVDPSGKTIFSHNPERPMVPASTLKVLTALAVLDVLGADYRFPTDFYLDTRGNLIIKGYGDPLLVSEVIAALAPTLAPKLPRTIQDILLDDAYFAEPLTIPGVSASTNPYDAPNGALCVNFNTVFFTHVDGRPRSAEAQTPLLPMVVERIRRSGLQQGRIVLSRHGQEAPLYAGRLFRHFLEGAGIGVRGEVRLASPEAVSQARRIHRHRSPYDLRQVIRRLLEYSNNYTANQLLLAAGARRFGPPASLDKGVRVLKDYAEGVLGIQDGIFREGSGISRDNRLSARAMMAALARFAPHVRLMPHEGREYYKTGTLKGVRTRAGYIEVQPGRFCRFVLFRNHRGHTTGPIMRQVHRRLAAHY